MPHCYVVVRCFKPAATRAAATSPARSPKRSRERARNREARRRHVNRVPTYVGLPRGASCGLAISGQFHSWEYALFAPLRRTCACVGRVPARARARAFPLPAICCTHDYAIALFVHLFDRDIDTFRRLYDKLGIKCFQNSCPYSFRRRI